MKRHLRILSALTALLMLLPLAVSCEHEHEWSEWTYDSSSHTRSCTVKKCEETEAAAHTFDGGTVTTPAKSLEAGVMTYTCTVCGYSYTEEIPQLLCLTLKEFDEFDTHTSLQKKYLADDKTSVTKYAVGTKELSYQQTPYFEWELTGMTDDQNLSVYTFYIGTKEDFSDAQVYTSRYHAYDRANGFNLYVRTKYYWKVVATIQNADGTTFDYESKTSSFTTLEGPRTLCVDGIANFRDLGGKDCDGGVIRQGILFRCGRLNSNYVCAPSVSKTGIKTLTQLGIKSEIDLRGSESDGKWQNGFSTSTKKADMYSHAGKDIKYYFCPGIYSSSILSTQQGKEMIKMAFDVLADESNYPIIFHCSIGTDRTGMVAFLTEGICGVSFEDMARDYLFSNFGNIGSERTFSTLTTVISPITAMSGSNYMEKCQNYLKSCGVTDAQIESIRNILIEKQ